MFVSREHAEDVLIRDSLKASGFRLSHYDYRSQQATREGDLTGYALLVMDAEAPSRALERLIERALDTVPAILLVGGHVQQARFGNLVRAGKAIFVRRPLDLDYLGELLGDIYQDAEADSRRGKRRQKPVALDQFGPIYGSSPAMRRMYLFLRKAAASDAVLCIHGESGAGKELVAEAVHAYSPRHNEPFEAINCAAIPADLVESELFGHEKGSFSGAIADHAGVFERVESGTLLLDEITEMPKSMQVKLLRVLETGRYRRVGGESDQAWHARIIAATNRNPMEAVREGRLREDLYYRISQLEVRVPPLRERGRDIIELSRLFVDRFNRDHDRRLRFTAAAERRLADYGWPGNVRQLWNVIQKACTTNREVVDVDGLPLNVAPTAEVDTPQRSIAIAPGTSLAAAERSLIEASLSHFEGNKPATAAALGISLRTLYARLNAYRQDSPQGQEMTS
jgi:DNA-binding NtrC family response regulator